MNATSSSPAITNGPVRVFYHHLLTPTSQSASAYEKKYSVTMLIPKSDPEIKKSIDDAIAAAMEKGVQTKWNGIAPPRPAIPLYDGDDLRANGEPFGNLRDHLDAARCICYRAAEEIEAVFCPCYRCLGI
jgi:hypothetical protein